jgi:hypothetical protein
MRMQKQLQPVAPEAIGREDDDAFFPFSLEK